VVPSNSSNLDLLGGIVMSPGGGGIGGPPPLVGVNTLGIGGGPNYSSLTMAPTQNDFFGMGSSQQPSSMMMMMTSSAAANNTSNNNNSTTTATISNNKKPTMWDNVGKVDIDLDNLSLKGKNQKKGMPMNALATPNSSPVKKPGVMGVVPPPLKAAQNPSQGSLNDLL
jgi:hypothetical protein